MTPKTPGPPPCEIGVPVVVKPQDGNQGKGVTVNIATREQSGSALMPPRGDQRGVLVERFVPGNDFRLLVVGDKLVAAARREPPQVIGDGVHTVRQLVEQVNGDPRRGVGHATSLTKIRFDDIALACLADAGPAGRFHPRQGHARASAQQRQSVHRRHRHRRHRRRASRGGALAPWRPRRWSAWTSAASTWCATAC